MAILKDKKSSSSETVTVFGTSHEECVKTAGAEVVYSSTGVLASERPLVPWILEKSEEVKDFAEQYGAENIVVVLGAAEGRQLVLAAETVTAERSYFCRSSSRSPVGTRCIPCL